MRYSFAAFPAVRLLVCAVAGICAGRLVHWPPSAWLALSVSSGIAVAAALLLDRRRPSTGTAVPAVAASAYLLLIVCVFGLNASFRFRAVAKPALLSWAGRDVIVSGTVHGRPERGRGGAAFMLRASGLFEHGRTMRLEDNAKVFVSLSPDQPFDIREGDFVRVKGRPGLVAAASNTGEYDPRLQARFKGIHVQIFCPRPGSILKEDPPGGFSFARSVVVPLRRYLAESIDRRFPPGREAVFVKGMILGERELLPDELADAFRRTGTAHVIAVSGLHVALLAYGISLCLQRLKTTRPGRWLSFCIFVAILAAYSAVTGNSPSIRRAAVMSAVMIGAGVTGRKAMPFNSLAVSDLCILLLDPLDLFNAGFQMTNAAVTGILAAYGPLNRLVPEGKGIARKALSAVWGAFCVSLSAMAGVCPLIALLFGTVSVSGIVANLPVVLFSNLAMYAALPLFLFHGFSGWAAGLFASASWFFARLTIESTMLFSRLPLASIEVKPGLFEVAACYATIGGILFFMTRQSLARAAMVLLAGLNLMLWPGVFERRPEPPGLLTVNLGRELAVLLSSGSETLLVDAGRKPGAWERIRRQAAGYGMPPVTAAVSLFSPDSVLAAVPVPNRLPVSGNALVLASAVVARQDERVVRIDTRRRSVLLVSGMGRLMKAKPASVDLLLLWMYRFTGKQWRELDSWLDASKPKRVLIVQGAFMTAEQRELLARYARQRKGVAIRSRSRQWVVP